MFQSYKVVVLGSIIKCPLVSTLVWCCVSWFWTMLVLVVWRCWVWEDQPGCTGEASVNHLILEYQTSD